MFGRRSKLLLPLPRPKKVCVCVCLCVSYLIKEWIVASFDSRPMRFTTSVHLDNGFNVVSWQLATFYDPEANLIGHTRGAIT